MSFVAKRAQPELLDRTYVSLSAFENISSELQQKFETAAQNHKKHIDGYTAQLKVFKDSTADHLRKLANSVQKHKEDRKNVLKFVRNMKVIAGVKQKMTLVLAKWKNITKDKKKGKILIKKMIKAKDLNRMKRGWNRIKGAYLLCRMKNFEGKSIRALLRADDCQNKLLEILPEVFSMKQNKANAEDVVKLATSVQRINYSSVFNDFVGLINDESNKIQQELLQISQNCDEKLAEFKKNIEKFSHYLKAPEFLQDIQGLKSQVSSLGNMQVLLSEKVAKIDYINKKEENEFKMEVMTKQIKNLENRMMNISSSQENIHDQTVYLKNILQFAKPSSASVRMSSTMGTRTGDTGVGVTPNLAESDLTVSGVYFKPGKRVSSASPGKKRVFNLNRKHRIPTSFSSTLSITETPSLCFNKHV